MGDILNEAYGVIQCKECPWYKNCVTPMRFTTEDLKRQIDAQANLLGQASPMDSTTQGMLSGMAMAAQNSLLESCPVFIDRLRNNPELSLRLKKLMQSWGKEDVQ